MEGGEDPELEQATDEALDWVDEPKDYITNKDGNVIPVEYMECENDVIDFTEELSKSASESEVKSFIKDAIEKGQPYVTLSPDWMIDLKGNSRARRHIIYPTGFEKMSAKEKAIHRKYVMAFEKLINNAKYIDYATNKKPEEKPNVEKYHYFLTKVVVGGKRYDVILDTEQYKGESEEKPQIVHLYNIKSIKK